MTWAWHKLQCCCEEVGGCEQYVPCCINGVEATWAIRSEPSAAQGGSGGTLAVKEGIVSEVKLTNLCNSGVGDDWSQFINTGANSFRKEWATTTNATTPNGTASFQTQYGCLTNLNIDPKHLVCPCESASTGGFNFQLDVLVHNCKTTSSTYYLEVGSSSLCFSIGNGRVNPYNCCMVLGGYSIDDGPIITVIDDDFWVPLNIVSEDFPVKASLFFKHNPECQDCIDTNQTTPLTVANERFGIPADPLYPFRFTPRKECYELVCNRAATGLPTFPLFTAEAYDSCLDCKAVADAIPSISTPTFDSRLIICDNCWWAVAFNTNPTDPILGYGTDADCVCGCPSCNELAITRGPDRCIKPTGKITSSPDSESGSTSVCGSEAQGLIWHGTRFDGCTPSTHRFDTSIYVGPYGQVQSDGTDGLSTGTVGGLVISDLTPFNNCDSIPIAWNNVINGTDGGGNNCYDVSMTILGETWTANRCPGGPPPGGVEGVPHTILWKIDHDC